MKACLCIARYVRIVDRCSGLERRSVNPGSNPVLRCRTLGKSFYVPRLIQLYDYLTIDRGGYLCTNSFNAVCAVWLSGSERRGCVQLNKKICQEAKSKTL